MKPTSAICYLWFFASQSAGSWTSTKRNGAGATSPLVNSVGEPVATQALNKRATSPDKWCKSQRGLTSIIASSSMPSTTATGNSQPLLTSSSSTVSPKPVSPSTALTSYLTSTLTTASSRPSFANSTSAVGLTTVSSTTTSTSTLTTTVTRSLPISLSPPPTTSSRSLANTPLSVTSSASFVSTAPSKRPASTILVLGGPHSTLTLTNSDLLISTAIDHVSYVLSTYITNNTTKTSVLGPLISTCMPTTTVTAAGVNGSATVTFAQCGTGIGPMITPSVAQQISKREYVEESIFASWTMVEPQTVTNQPSIRAASSMQSQRKNSRSDPLILLPTGNAAGSVKPLAMSTLLIMLGLFILFNAVTATSPPAPSTPAQVSNPAKSILPFYCAYSTQGYLVAGTIHTFSWIPACPTGFAITDYGNSPFELTSTSYPPYLHTRVVTSTSTSSSPHPSGASKRDVSTTYLEEHETGLPSEPHMKARHRGRGGIDHYYGTGDQNSVKVPHMILFGIFLLVLLSCLVPFAIGDGLADESITIRSAEESKIHRHPQARLKARKGAGKSIKVKSSKRKDKPTGDTSDQGRVRVPQRLLLGLALYLILACFLSFASAKSGASESITDPVETFAIRGTCFNGVGVQYPCDCATNSACISGTGRIRPPLNRALLIALGLMALFWGPASGRQTLGRRNDSVWPKVETTLPSTNNTVSPMTTDMTCIMSGMNATVGSQVATSSKVIASSMPAIMPTPASTVSGEVTHLSQPQLPAATTASETSMVCVYGSGWPSESAGATMNCISTASSSSTQTASSPASPINGAVASSPLNLCSDGSGLLLPCPSSAAERKSPQLGATDRHLMFCVGLTLLVIIAAKTWLQ